MTPEELTAQAERVARGAKLQRTIAALNEDLIEADRLPFEVRIKSRMVRGVDVGDPDIQAAVKAGLFARLETLRAEFAAL